MTDRPDSSGPGSPRSTTVLVVDDEPLVLSTVRRTLEFSGYEVECAVSVDEAVGVLKKRGDEVDVAVVDLTIGEQGAPSVVAALREVKETLPVLLISGYPLDEHSDAVRDARADGFLSKPFRPEDLERVIRRVLTTIDR